MTCLQPTASLVETTSMRGEGVTGVYSGNRVIRMFPGALIALLEVHDGVHGCCGFVCRHTTIAEQSDVRR